MPSFNAKPRRKNRLRLGFLAALIARLLVTGEPARAEPAPESAVPVISVITLDELVRRVEARDPRLAVVQARVDRSRAEVAAAGRTSNPSLGYEREEVFADGEGVPEDRLVLSWPLEISGRRAAAVRAAESELAATEAEVGTLRATLVFDAIATYYEVALAQARVVRLEEGRARLGALKGIIAKRYAAGQASTYDQARLELELASWDDLHAGATSELEGARRRLAILAGEPGSLSTADTSDATVPTLPPLPDLTDIAAQRPDYIAAESRREAARHHRTAARRAGVPDLVLDAGLRSADVGLGGRAWGYVAGVSIELPLYARAPGERERADAAAREAEATLALVEARAPAEVAQAHRALASAIARVEAFRASQLAPIDALKKAVDTAYREGDRPILEVVDVYRTTRDLALRELDLIARARMAEQDLWRALGRRP